MLKWVKIRDGHDNFFTPLRFLFAYLVLIGHSFVVSGGDSSAEPHVFYHYTFSYIAVNLFFIASGFLVTASMLYRKDAASFASARFLRIYPGLFVHILIMMFVFGVMTTSLPIGEYLTHKQTLIQPLLVLPFIKSQMFLPGIVENNHEHMASAALWTLRYEVLAYMGTFAAFSLGLMRQKWMLAAQFILFLLAWPVLHLSGLVDHLPATLQLLLRFGLVYGLGAAIYAFRDKIKFHILGIPVMFGLAALSHKTVMFEPVLDMALAYALFWAAYVKLPKLNIMKTMPDVSYGLYIYHWSVLQGIRHYWPEVTTLQLILLSTPISIALAALSWYLIEKPALKLKDRLTEHLRRKPAPALAE